jgi:shikimate kinase
VVSTGGGLPTVQENVLLMLNHGIIIHVDRPLDQILSDIKMERRPTLAGGSYENVIDQYNERIGHYKACADYRLDNSHGFTVGLQTLTQLVEGLK